MSTAPLGERREETHHPTGSVASQTYPLKTVSSFKNQAIPQNNLLVSDETDVRVWRFFVVEIYDQIGSLYTIGGEALLIFPPLAMVEPRRQHGDWKLSAYG
jgi:hypothetical protein